MRQGRAAGPWLSLWLWAPGQVDSVGGGDPPICLQSCPETGGRCPLSRVGLGSPPGVRQQAELSAWRSGPASWGSFCAGTSRGLFAWCLFFCFIWHSVRKSVVYAHPAVLNGLCLRGLRGRDPRAAGPAFWAASEQQAVSSRK